MSAFHCTRQDKAKGFAFSMDAVLGIILLLALLLFTQTSLLEQSSITYPNTQLNQTIEDAVTAVDESGYVIGEIDDVNGFSQLTTNNILKEIKGVLPQNIDLNISLKQFTIADIADCRSIKDFETCFPVTDQNSYNSGKAIPSNKQIVHGRRLFIKKQPPGECVIEAALAESKSLKKPVWYFQEDLNIIFEVEVNPSDAIECDENVYVTLRASMPEGMRKPVDIMLVMDRSGSMSWHGNASTSNAQGIWVSGNYAYIADGSSGLRVIDVTDPLLPNFADSYDPGTVSDVTVSGNTVFVAETGGDRIYSVNATNPNNLSVLDNLRFDSITGVFALGNYLYVAGDGRSKPNGFHIVDATNPSNLSYTGSLATNSPQDVFVVGNFAYLADGSAGLRIIDVATKNAPVIRSTYNTPGTAQGVFVVGNTAFVADGSSGLIILDVTNKLVTPILLAQYNTPDNANNVFVSGNYAFVADDSSLIMLDVSNPSAPILAERYLTPYNYYDVFVQNSFAFIATGNMGLVTFAVPAGPKINIAKRAAETFIDYDGWKMPPDKVGLVSYATSATLDSALTTVKSDVNAAVYSSTLIASGSTNIERGITAANTEIIAHRNPAGLQFEVLLSDGQSTEGHSAIAASAAAAAGIKIYTVGFGEDASVSELTNIANITGGKFYYASDENALDEIYKLIAKEIEESANDANVSIPLTADVIVENLGGGEIIGGNLTFTGITISPSNPWETTYILNFPCNAICDVDAIQFPGEGTTLSYIDTEGTHTVEWGESVIISFKYRDLTVHFTGGRIFSENEVQLDVNSANIGHLNAEATNVNFHWNTLDGAILGNQIIPETCGDKNASCPSPTVSSFIVQTSTVGQTGDIYAHINESEAIRECPNGNWDVIHCYGSPVTQYYVLEYWGWNK